MRIAVAGAGIAGLTSAIALAQRGFSVEIFERAQALDEIGAGIQLSPNAMHVLRRLGVADDLAPHAVEPGAIEIRDGLSGRTLNAIPLGETARRRYGAPYLLVHRSDLQTVLLGAVRRQQQVALRLHAEVHDIRATEDGVVLRAAGQGFRADVLVAADGIASRVRAEHFGYPAPKPLGKTAWRAAIPATAMPDSLRRNVTSLWLGAGGHLVHYPLKAGRLFNIVVIATNTGGASPPLAPFGKEARGLLDAVPEWRPWPLFEVDPTLPYSRGRVALIGDAAHGMAPSAAQGGAQAIEDAWVLAAALDDTQPVTTALGSYARSRGSRAKRVSREARRNLAIYDMESVARIARNAVLGALPANVLLSRLDWLFKWQAG